jgi:hypothetical protein
MVMKRPRGPVVAFFHTLLKATLIVQIITFFTFSGAILPRKNCNDYSSVLIFNFLTLLALAISHLLKPAALTLLD